MRKIIVAILLLTAIMACTSIDCPVQNLVYTQYAIMKSDGTPDTLNTDTIWIWTTRVDDTDTLLLSSSYESHTLVLNSLYGSNTTTFALPISNTLPEDVFYLLLRDTLQQEFIDTFVVQKEDFPHFESVDCQASYFHELKAVSTTHHTIDSISIHYSEVNYDLSKTHFYIYFKAASER